MCVLAAEFMAIAYAEKELLRRDSSDILNISSVAELLPEGMTSCIIICVSHPRVSKESDVNIIRRFAYL